MLPERLIQNLLIFGAALIALLILRAIILRWIRRKANHEDTIPYHVGQRLHWPTLMWCLAGALDASVRYADLTERQEHLAHLWIVIFLIASFTMVGSVLLIGVADVYGRRRKMPFAVAGLSRTLIRIVVFSIGALSLLRYLGIPVTPALATLGVGGIAVALALQDTLANFFAGVHILIETPISVGQYIRISDHEEGLVTDIGWRTTRLTTPANNMLVIPNTKITTGILTNFDMPSARATGDLAIVVDHENDPAAVRELIMKAVGATEGVLSDPRPSLMFDPGVTPTHQQWKLVFSVASRLVSGAVKSDLNLRIAEEFRAAGVKLPTPRA